MRRESGFTLIELLIVLAILGILVGVVAMSLGGVEGSTVARGQATELAAVQRAIDTYNRIDVIVDGAEPIRARATPVAIGPHDHDAPFCKYLESATAFRYTWTAGGMHLTVSE
ncbi:MAG: prepilin-type N-terminal cleavage/methylation domain-containing protein [Chloroflexi bacterium]|nr:prepilin-type N-terminal cleavage/methylation domain-containing protein [Chloroflexota bacterium]